MGAPVVLFVIMTVINLAVSYMEAQDMKDELSSLKDSLSAGGYLANSQTQDEAVPVVYGKMRVGGNRVYVTTSGDNNRYIHLIMTLSEGPVEGIENIYLDDRPYTDFGGLVYYELFTGTATQSVSATLQAIDANWADAMRHTAYLYIRLEYNSGKFSQVPDITVVVKGRQLYDPRNGLTAYSANPALVWYDFMTNKRYGLGVSASLIDTASVIDSANWCDANGYAFNGVIRNRSAFLDNMNKVLTNFRGDIIWGDGKFKLIIRKYDSAVMSFTEDEIAAGSFKCDIPGLADTPNRIKFTYPDSDENWVSKTQTLEDSVAVLQYDLEERDTEVELIGTTGATQANKLAVYMLERARLNKIYDFVTHAKAFALEPGDIVTITHQVPGWTGRAVRVIDMGLTQLGDVRLSVMEEDPALYDAVLNLSPHAYFQTSLPDPLEPAGEVTNVSFVEEEYYNKDVSYTRLKVTFTRPASPFWEYSEVWVNIDSNGWEHYTNATGGFSVEPVKEGAAYEFKFISVTIQRVKSDFTSAAVRTYNVVGKNTPPPDVANFRAIPQSDTIVLMWDAVSAIDLQGYEVRRGVNWGGGIFMGFTRAVTFQLNGQPPGTHTFMIKSVDTNGKYSANYGLATCTVYGPASYTERMSEYNDFSDPGAWTPSTAYSLGAKKRPNAVNGYYFKCIVAGTSGTVEPSWPTSNGATVVDNTVTWIVYEDQIYMNTERYYDAQTGGWELRVIHVSGNFTGIYTSPVYDRGSIVTRRSWAAYDYLYEGTGAAWYDQFMSTDLWTDKLATADTWLKLFGNAIAGTLQMELGVSTNGTNWTWLKQFESYAIEYQCRYVRYRITITDMAVDGYLHCKPVTYKEAYWQ